MDDELGNHVPWYPDTNDENYNARMNSKHEYQIHAEREKRQNEIYFNRQRLTQIHLGSQTPNKCLLVYEDTGLGKTCNAIGIAETRHEWLSQYFDTTDLAFKEPTMNKAIIVAQNKTSLSDNFKQDIISTCTAGAYLTDPLIRKTHKTERGKTGARTRAIQTSYELHTQKAFAGILDAMTPEQIAIKYSFRVIILDEIHMYRAITKTVGENEYGEPVTLGGKYNYDMMMKLIDNVHGCIIVGLTATPVVNDINEFPSIINFILDKSDRVNPEKFASIANQGNIENIRKEMEEYLVPKLRGKIFRTKQSKSVSKSVVRSNEDPRHPVLSGNTRLYLSRIMQNNDDYIDYSEIINGYIAAMRADVTTNENQFYTNSNFASSMIWPHGLRRSEAFDKYLTNEGDGYRFSEDFKRDFRYHMHSSRLRLITIIEAELGQLRVAGNGDSSDAKIKETTVRALQKRINAFPMNDFATDNFDHNNFDDMRVMIYVIRSRYSPVFATILEIIMGIEIMDKITGQYTYVATPKTNSFNVNQFSIDDQDNRECAYVYNQYKPGAIFPYGLMLELFGYEALRLTEGSYVNAKDKITGLLRGKRYALLYSSDDRGGTGELGKITDAKMRKVLQLANHPDNKYGHYLKVVFGTDVTAQGINFRNIRQAHLSSRKWNEAGNIQAEGRVDRTNSHDAFKKDDPIPVFNFTNTNGEKDHVRYGVINLNGKETQKYVKIFRHVAYFQDPEFNVQNADGSVTNLSLGIKMYNDAIAKEIKNSIPLDIMERIATNRILSLQPDDVLPTRLIGFEGEYPRDYVTYNLFYARKELEDLKCRIRGHFKSNFILKLEDIIGLCIGSHRSTIIKALTEMVNTDERIIDRHGMLNYLREDGDVFFLQKKHRSLRKTSEHWMAYYSSHNFVHESQDIGDLYDKIEYLKIEELLDYIRTVQEGNYSRIISRIGKLSYKSRGFLVETLVQRSNIMRKQGRIGEKPLAFIFQELDPHVIYFPNNRIIIHVFNIKSRQIAGNRSSQLKIPESSRGELRIFALDEGIWRNSRYIEDIRYIPMINNHAEASLFRHIENFKHYGASVVEHGVHAFKLQDKYHIESTSGPTIRGQARRNSASALGRDCYPMKVSMLLWHLYSVIIDLYVLIDFYQPFDMPNGGPKIFPMIIKRAVKDEKGQFAYGPVRLSLDMNPLAPKTPDYPAGFPYLVTNWQDLIVTPSNYKLLATNIIINYKHVYPEILGLIFNNEILDIDTEILNPANKDFYPTFKVGKPPYAPLIPPLPIGMTRYSNILDIVPNGNPDYGGVELFSKLMGSNVDKTGFMFLDDGRYMDFSMSGSIFTSMRDLYQELFENRGYEGTDITRDKHGGNEKLDLWIEYPARFGRAYAGLVKQDLCLMIFTLYYLQRSLY